MTMTYPDCGEKPDGFWKEYKPETDDLENT